MLEDEKLIFGWRHSFCREIPIHGMKLLNLTLPSPEHNLACDEVLLNLCAEGGAECLRFWEPSRTFVVLGYADRFHREVNVETCRDLDLPILRRKSGGGAVLQQPGCLNYSLILRIGSDGPTRSIVRTNEYVMETLARAIRSDFGFEIKVQGFTDLALNDRKISGNAQRRLHRALLFHGSFLLQTDLSLISKILPFPSRQPAYRRGRSHEEFLANLSLKKDDLRLAIQNVWRTEGVIETLPMDRIEELVQKIYGNVAWTQRF